MKWIATVSPPPPTFSSLLHNFALICHIFQVAIKSIPKNKIEDPEDMRRIRQEIELMSMLDHPNIVNIYEGRLVHVTEMHVGL